MLLSTPAFAAFFVVVCLLYWAAYGSRRWQQVILLLANGFFLAKFGFIYLALALCATTDFLLGRAMGRPGTNKATRLLLLGVSLALNLFLLTTPKLLALNTTGRFDLLLRLSLSFYAFQAMSYTLDVYRGDAKPAQSWLAYCASALFFPSIVAGPIPRQAGLAKQMAAPFKLDNAIASRALLLIGMGLVKKLLIADFLADNLVNRVFDTPLLYSGLENLAGVYGYALQLYFDFSGYTDMAMGTALLLGLRLPENFRQPYLSANLQDFWKRWHISFSSWLTDYLFDPLPKSRRFLRLSFCSAFLVTFLLGGLWHGIAWTFVVWGLLHGLGLSTVFLWRRWRGKPGTALWGRVLGTFFTFHFVCFTWVFFRAASVGEAIAVLRQIGSGTWDTANLTPKIVAVLLTAAALHCIPPSFYEKSAKLSSSMPFWVQGGALAALILAVQTLAGKGSAPFVYGKF